ncbi:MAG: 1-deoxy-D-xylulose-5-phosphate synthase [Oscillospiraceae bacterium]|nr:1-deoxy-D-xylulose-5-phosphate synthase [Oscillospiraceae bacterium]
MKILNTINSPADLKKVPAEEIPALCGELREFLIENVSKTGGHFASNLGTVELTVALDRVYDPEKDRIVFDVGHQSYAHKILTGRRDDFSTLRQFGGLSGFPKPRESSCDAFITGHASTSVSVALGMARARTLQGQHYDVCAVIGDGSMTGGLAYEAIADAGQSGEPLVVILNDNAMSISQSVGGMASILSQMRTKPAYFNFKRLYHKTIGQIGPVYRFIHRIKEWVKSRVLPGNMFVDMGFYYLGPIDGHDEQTLEQAIVYAREMRIPVLLHVITVKGKGYPYAEEQPDKYHGVSGFNPLTGIVPKTKDDFSSVFGRTLTELAETDQRITAITAAMLDGTGLNLFQRQHPDRLFDVGICEEHAVTMAAGMASQGLKPVICVYSSFLQRGYDMLIHDVSLSGAHVVFGVDRAGLVGADGETHHGVFDVNYLCSVPNMTVLCPASFAEVQVMLKTALEELDGPVAVRYPRGGEGSWKGCETADAAVVAPGRDVTIVCYGTMINNVLDAARQLEARGISPEIVKLSRIDTLDFSVIGASLEKTKRLLVAEEVCAAGCVGTRLLAECARQGLTLDGALLLNLGGGIVPHGTVEELKALYALDGNGIAYGVLSLLDRMEDETI